MGRIDYYKRIFSAYLGGNTSQLSFWHGEPEVNENFEPGKLGEYYMPFIAKANYPGFYDNHGIPMLDYRGVIGHQYNPIAIAQYGLGNYNLYRRTGEESRKSKFIKVADWLVHNLEDTPQHTKVWYHHFDWEYRDTLKMPWYSALAQGQGLSVLVRAHQETEQSTFLEAANQAFVTFEKDVSNGGVSYTDNEGYIWFEEAIVDPPTHILNGFIWAAWGVYDYYLHTRDNAAKILFDRAVKTLKDKLALFDTCIWSLYEQSGTRMKMLASQFYHSLHIVQLKIMHRITGEPAFQKFAEKWTNYRKSFIRRNLAIAYKAVFKIIYY